MAGTKAKCQCGTVTVVPTPKKKAASSESIVVQCPACGQRHKAQPSMAGTEAKCTCGQIISIPSTSGPTAATQPTNDAWQDLGAVESVSATFATGGQLPPAAGHRTPRAKRSLPSWLLPAGLVVGGIAVVGILAVFVVSFISGYSSAARKASDERVADWKTFQHPSGGFTIAVPGHVDNSDSPTPQAGGFCSRMLDANSRSSDGTLVSVNLYVGVVSSTDGTPQYQRYGERLWGSHPDVVSSRIEMFGAPGLEYKGTVQEDGDTRWVCSRVLLLDDRLYELTLQRKSAEPMDASKVEAFFATFQPSELNE
jgi:hypothetical protein